MRKPRTLLFFITSLVSASRSTFLPSVPGHPPACAGSERGHPCPLPYPAHRLQGPGLWSFGSCQ